MSCKLLTALAACIFLLGIPSVNADTAQYANTLLNEDTSSTSYVFFTAYNESESTDTTIDQENDEISDASDNDEMTDDISEDDETSDEDMDAVEEEMDDDIYDEFAEIEDSEDIEDTVQVPNAGSIQNTRTEGDAQQDIHTGQNTSVQGENSQVLDTNTIQNIPEQQNTAQILDTSEKKDTDIQQNKAELLGNNNDINKIMQHEDEKISEIKDVLDTKTSEIKTELGSINSILEKNASILDFFDFSTKQFSIKASHVYGILTASLVIIILLILFLIYYLRQKIAIQNNSFNDFTTNFLTKNQDFNENILTKLDLFTNIPLQNVQNTSKFKIEDQHLIVKSILNKISFMEVTMSKMDSSVRGFKQLSKSITQIKDSMKVYGYEFIEMLGKPYNEGMKVVANFIDDETIPAGQQIITGVTKPQINFRGVMIQSAQITVSQNIGEEQCQL